MSKFREFLRPYRLKIIILIIFRTRKSEKSGSYNVYPRSQQKHARYAQFRRSQSDPKPRECESAPVWSRDTRFTEHPLPVRTSRSWFKTPSYISKFFSRHFLIYFLPLLLKSLFCMHRKYIIMLENNVIYLLDSLRFEWRRLTMHLERGGKKALFSLYPQMILGDSSYLLFS